MDPGFYFLVPFVIYAGARAVIALCRHDAMAAYKAAAKELGIDFRHGQLQGNVGNCSVAVIRDPFARFEVAGRAHPIPSDLVLEKEGLRSTIDKARGGQDIETHDADFDSQVRVRGDEPQVVALLDSGTRALVLREIDRGVVLEGGKVHWRTMSELGAAMLVTRVRDLVELASALSLDPARVPEKLARNAVCEQGTAVRLRNLEVLLKHFGCSEEARKASLELCRFQDPRLRLLAAKHLGLEGIETLKSLVDGLGVTNELRCEALELLASLPTSEALPVLEKMLSSRIPELRRAAVAAIGQRRHAPAFDQLRRMVGSAEGDIAAAIVISLAQVGGVAAEPVLIGYLQRKDAPVRVAAANALGRVGTIAAIEPLQSAQALGRTGMKGRLEQLLTGEEGALVDADFYEAARVAIDLIQARLGNVEEGRLSLADSSPREGALSLATEAGKLAIAGPSDSGGEASGSENDGTLPVAGDGKISPPNQEVHVTMATPEPPPAISEPPAQNRSDGEARA